MVVIQKEMTRSQKWNKNGPMKKTKDFFEDAQMFHINETQYDRVYDGM